MGSSVTDSGELTREHWRWVILASMADYIDAGSIVAGAAALSIWANAFHMSDSLVGLLGAFSSNAISAGIGALIGGRLGDKVGRKKLYQYDLLVYIVGAAILMLANSQWVLILGYLILGLAVGADIPTSWALVSEISPSGSRAKLMGLGNIFWYIGPLVTLGLALLVSDMGMLGVRILFAHLIVVAAVTWYLRRGLVESERWQKAHLEEESSGSDREGTTMGTSSKIHQLFSDANLRSLVFVTSVYGLWNLVAGTYGFFLPYILHSVGGASPAEGDALQALWFISAIISVAFVFMRYGDRPNRKPLYIVSAGMQTLAFVLFIFFPVSNTMVAIANVVLFGFGQGIAAWPLYRLWSVELFPTLLRGTAQGVITGILRIGLGFWSLFLPILTRNTGFKTVATIMTVFLLFTLIVGTLFLPNTGGKSLEEIQRELQSTTTVSASTEVTED